MSKVTDLVKEEFMTRLKEFLEEKEEEVLLVKSGTYSIPWVKDEEEGFINITFSIPKGARDGEGYDGYEEAQNYAIECAEKEEKKRKKEEEKEKKKEHDKKMREEKKKKKEEEGA